MSGSVNKVILVGNLGRDPEVRSTQDGTTVANLAVATSENWRDKATGDRKERVEWHKVVIFNDRLVEVAQKYLHKGSKIYLEGALQTRKWTDKGGQDQYTTEIVLQKFRGELRMLDGVRSSGQAQSERGTTRATATAAGFGGKPGMRDDLDDDIPFAACDPTAEPYLKRRVVL